MQGLFMKMEVLEMVLTANKGFHSLKVSAGHFGEPEPICGSPKKARQLGRRIAQSTRRSDPVHPLALYTKDPVFAQIIKDCEEWETERWMRDRSFTPYSKFNGFLLKGKRLCVPMSSWRELFVREAHNGGLMGHFGINKTMGILEE
ncbi:hypothetical protein MTR67_034553 [Solanum verrucosum]|uniref:Integrase zinc-binding domain-containing protein n=1 Tax=Solanum verrucosum TaxID=315347 RepID=A0AAF0U806_SOLVR|nr:hypothetical protein MTR67_034553 [Solanum verrucosum]